MGARLYAGLAGSAHGDGRHQRALDLANGERLDDVAVGTRARGALQRVVVGVRGRAECPNYLIEYVREDAKTHERVTHQDAAYSGSTHRELAVHHIAEVRNWSPEEMNITAVSALIGRLRNPRAPSSRFVDED